MARAVIPSPMGAIEVLGDDAGVRAVGFLDGAHATVEADAAPVRACAAQLAEYFAGTRRAFDLPLAPEGTAFQRRVWDALARIPFGTTTSYAALAERVGGATYTRAVGLANGANPIGIIVPCHRVIGADGSLVGYAGGMHRKRALLDHEARVAGRGSQSRLDAFAR